MEKLYKYNYQITGKGKCAASSRTANIAAGTTATSVTTAETPSTRRSVLKGTKIYII
jgi:hypothetical protein